jgi:VanZ family protein
MQRIFLALFWAATLFTFVMAELPHPPSVPLEPSDKVQHIAAFLTLTALAAAAYPRAALWKIALGLAAFGALIEVVQAIPALHRDSDVNDWLADVAAVAGMCVPAALLRRRASRSG